MVMLSRRFIDTAYNTKGNELLKFVRAEVMEQIELQEKETVCTQEQFNLIVDGTMRRIKTIVTPLIEVEVDKI